MNGVTDEWNKWSELNRRQTVEDLKAKFLIS